MQKGILYAMLLAALIILSSSAFALSDSSCTSWTTISTSNYDINAAGCYRLATDSIVTVHNDVTYSGPVIIDANTHRLNLRTGFPPSLDTNMLIENGTVQLYYPGTQFNAQELNIYNAKITGFFYIPVQSSSQVTLEKVTQDSGSTISFNTPGDVMISDSNLVNVLIGYPANSVTVTSTTVSSGFAISAKTVNISDSNLPLYTVITGVSAPNNLSFTNSTINGHQVLMNTTNYNVGDYVLDYNLSYFGANEYGYLGIYGTVSGTLDFSGANVDVLATASPSEIADLTGNNGGTILLLYIPPTTVPSFPSFSQSYIRKIVLVGRHIVFWNYNSQYHIYDGVVQTTSDSQVTVDFLNPVSINYRNSYSRYINYELYGDSNIVAESPGGGFDETRLTLYSNAKHIKIYGEDPNGPFTIDSLEVQAFTQGAELNFSNVEFTADPSTLTLDSNVSVILSDAEVDNELNIVCNTGGTVLFEGTTDPSKINVTGCTVVTQNNSGCTSWTDITTNTTITQSGCYRVGADNIQLSLHLDNNTADNVVIDLNGHTVTFGNSTTAFMGNDMNDTVEIYGGTIHGSPTFYATHKIYIHDINADILSVDSYYDDTNILIEHSRVGDIFVYTNGQSDRVELNYVKCEGDFQVTGTGAYIKIYHTAVQPYGCAGVYVTGSPKTVDIEDFNSANATNEVIAIATDSTKIADAKFSGPLVFYDPITPYRDEYNMTITNTYVYDEYLPTPRDIPVIYNPDIYDSTGGQLEYNAAYIVPHAYHNMPRVHRLEIAGDWGMSDEINSPNADVIAIKSTGRIEDYNGIVLAGKVAQHNAYICYPSPIQLPDIVDSNIVMPGVVQDYPPEQRVGRIVHSTLQIGGMLMGIPLIGDADSTIVTNKYFHWYGYSGDFNITIGVLYTDSFNIEDPGTIIIDHIGKLGPYSGTMHINIYTDTNTIFRGITLTAPYTNKSDSTINISVDEFSQEAGHTVTFDNVSVDGITNVHITCVKPDTVVLAGTTDPSKFTFQNCNVINNTVKPNLTITTSDTYHDYAEGAPVEFNVTVTDYNAPVDNVVVRAYANNYYTQFNQTQDKVIPHLDANQSVTLTFEFNLPSSPATYKLYAVVDPDNNIAESNENDNSTLVTSQKYYVNVYRYIHTCQQLTTGTYKLDNHMTDVNDNCFVVPHGEIVTFLGGYGIEAPSDWTTIFVNHGQLNINGLWGKGKIYNASDGVMNLSYVTPYQSTGFMVYNDGELYLLRNNDIKMQFVSGGTVHVMGPNDTIHSIQIFDFAGNRTISFMVSDGAAVYNGELSNFQNATLYSDKPISDPNGVYVYTSTQPQFASGVTSVKGIILGPGIDANLGNVTIGGIEVGGKLGHPVALSFNGTTINGAGLMVWDQPNHYAGNPNGEVNMTSVTFNANRLELENADAHIDSSNINTNFLIFDTNSNIYLKNTNLVVNNPGALFNGDAKSINIYADLTTNDSTINIPAISNNSNATIHIYCTGTHWLHLNDAFKKNSAVVLDPACNWNIDYNRNITVAVQSAPEKVTPDSNYQVTFSVCNEGNLSTIPAGMVAYQATVDGVPTVNGTIDQNIAPGACVPVTLTFHASPDVGGQEISFSVDTNNAVPELNENDNTVTLTMTIAKEQAPTGGAVPLAGAGGPTGASATGGLYVSAKIGQTTKTAIHVSWEYGYPARAEVYYFNEKGTITGPDHVTLHTGDNVIPIKVTPKAYGEIGKVTLYVMNKKLTTTIYARPMAQMNAGILFSSKALGYVVLIGLAAYLLYSIFL